jgi:hypothetical protein
MATEKVVVDVEIKATPAIASVKSLKAELRQVTNELSNLEEGSQAFIDAATKAGELKDKIGDVRNAVDAFNPEKKFQALAGVVGIAANGFAAMQGAMALMGSESEDLNKVMAKTQGAIALTSGLNGLLGMKDAFKLLGSQVLKLIPALNSMGAAMLGAITGGIAIALVLIIAYWKDLKFLITGTIDEVKLTADEMANAVKKGHDDYKRAANERSAIAEREARLKLKGLELDLELAKIDRQRKIDEAVSSGKLADEKVLIEAEYQKSIADTKEKYRKEAEDKKKKEDEKEKSEAEKKAKALFDSNKFWANESDKTVKYQAEYRKEFEDLKQTQLLKNVEEQKKIDDINTENALAQIELEKQKAVARQQYFQEGANYLNQAADLLGKNTAEGKVLAVASATISTYLSAQKAYASFADIPVVGIPLGIAAAGISIAAGIANVNKILAVQVPGQSGGGGGGGLTAPSTPSIPRIPQSLSGSMLNQNRPMDINNMNTTGKVIVTETDITNTQDKVKGIIRKATIK